MPLQVAVDVRLVSAEALAKVLGRLAALVLDVTVEAVLPLVLALAVAARPRLRVVGRVHHFVAVRQALALDAALALLGGVRRQRQRRRHLVVRRRRRPVRRRRRRGRRWRRRRRQRRQQAALMVRQADDVGRRRGGRTDDTDEAGVRLAGRLDRLVAEALHRGGGCGRRRGAAVVVAAGRSGGGAAHRDDRHHVGLLVQIGFQGPRHGVRDALIVGGGALRCHVQMLLRVSGVSGGRAGGGGGGSAGRCDGGGGRRFWAGQHVAGGLGRIRIDEQAVLVSGVDAVEGRRIVVVVVGEVTLVVVLRVIGWNGG